ncbi:MAG: HD domain-containing phosphohydrolase [Pseudomonadota bacterium]
MQNHDLNATVPADDELSFAAEVLPAEVQRRNFWKLLIVDDEEEVHRVTKLALGGFEHDGRSLHFIDAYTGQEAREVMAREPDIALVLMDVVMETDHAGLDAIQHIRQTLGNRLTRIVLRTGQPGQAPEREVITRYDINDYRDKTELTAQKLFTLLYTGLSLYKDLQLLEHSREGLQQLVAAASGVFQCKVPTQLADGVVGLACALLGVDGSRPGSNAADTLMLEHQPRSDGATVLAASGSFSDLRGRALYAADDLTEIWDLQQTSAGRQWVAEERRFYATFPGSGGETFGLYLRASHALHLPEPKLVDMFCRNVASALQSAQLHQQVNKTQRELIVMLSEAIEKRSRETGNHVRRVGEYSRLFGQLWGMDEDECETLLIAAPLHDAGKIAIPDAILNKPGRLTDEEFIIMRTHAMLGGQMFEGHGLPVLKAAAILAGQHHERWDGQGYPLRIAGEAIHIYGRIVAVADVFDALGSDRCYKKAWDMESILAYMRAESGKQFDPVLIQLLMDNLDDFLAIRDRYHDSFSEAGMD